MTETITTQQIAKNYSAMLDSVNLIDGIVSGNVMIESDPQEREACVSRNVGHLTIMLGEPYWTTEDMSVVEDAIASGEIYAAI